MGTKALRNTKNSSKDALLRAEKADKALKNYPFSDISQCLTIKINPRAKRMALRLDPKKHQIKLVVPKNHSMRDAYLFALEHKYWIRQKIADLPAPVRFEAGAIIPILGENHTIKVTYDINLKKTDITLKNKEILVFTNKEDPTSRIKRFIIALAKERLTALSHEKAAMIDKTIKSVEVKAMSTRWGSCSEDGKLSYSWRLIFAPPHAFDYVVAHECAHLIHMDHSPDFWDVCEDLSSSYSKGKSWMKRHSGELVRYN